MYAFRKKGMNFLMEEIFVIDRIENDIAICENRLTREIIKIEISKLPKGIKEGNIIKYYNGIYRIDFEEQKKIEEQISKLMDELWND